MNRHFRTIRTAILLSTMLLITIIPAHLDDCRAESFTGETRLLKKLDPVERLTYFGLQYLMNNHQKRHYLSRPTRRERDEWIDQFWVDLDPTPTTEENERRTEHERRVALARRLFKMKKAPGWDKRGETLIRFGMPSYRAKTWGNIGFYEVTPPGEVWHYESLDMIISFQNFSLKGEYIYSIEPYGKSSRRELDRVKNVFDLLYYGILQPILPTEYMDYDEIKDLVDFNPDDIDYIADQDVRIEQSRDLIAGWEREKTEKKINNFYKYMKEKPTIYSFEMNRELLTVFFDVTSFKGGPEQLRTEVNFAIPASEIFFLKEADSLECEVTLRVQVRDINTKPISYGEDVIRAIQRGGETFVGPSFLPGQAILTLEPGYYRLGIEAVDTYSGRRGVLRTNLELRPFGESLAISDIQFASTITETEETRKFLKGNVQVIPHPLHAYRIPFPVSFYFEIYGLKTNKEGLAYYAVEYRIVALQKRRRGPVFEEIAPAITSRFETTGYGSTQTQTLSIATENLWEGPFKLTVVVTDRRTRESVEKDAKFSILD
ncbi:MAG: GWxTD domain-containing protein [bacterium]|nr:MAG: GWxTD domain-containing protein [bacterium]